MRKLDDRRQRPTEEGQILEARVSFDLRRTYGPVPVAALALAAIATTVVAKNEKHAITVLAEPTLGSFDLGADVTVKLTITNNGKGRMSFQTCPNEVYAVELKDSQGMPVPKRVPIPPVEKNGELILPAELANLTLCARNISVTLETGKAWSESISLGQYVDFKLPGSYTGTVIWLADNATAGEIPSNTFRFTIRAKQQS